MGFLQFARLAGISNVVVFIVGSGLVKSRFLDILLRDENVDVQSNVDRTASAQEVKTRKCRFKGMGSDIVLVDAPSFGIRGGPDGGEAMEKWIRSNCNGRWKAAGILYLHNITSSSDDPTLGLSLYLDAFRRVFPEGRAPGTVHVVPTIFGKRMSNESIKASMTQLRCEVDGVGASVMGEPFDDEPKTALHAVTYLSQKAEWESLSGMIEVQRAGPKDKPAGQRSHYETSAKLADLLFQRYRIQYRHFYGEKEKKLDLDEIIILRRRALRCTPTEHPNYISATVSLADILSERFEREGERRDLDEMIPIRRAALEFSARGHGEHLDSLVNLANCLD